MDNLYDRPGWHSQYVLDDPALVSQHTCRTDCSVCPVYQATATLMFNARVHNPSNI